MRATYDSKNNLNTIIFVLIFLLTFCLSAFLRVYAIYDRPFHNDEGVNYFFIQSMFKSGYYEYSHENYHGPTFFYLCAFTNYLFGADELGHRMAAILPSMAIVFSPFLAGGLISRSKKILCSLLLAVSPSVIYYGRYSIHESLLVFLCMWFLFSVARWFEYRSPKILIEIGLVLGLIISTKETYVVFLASAAVSLFFVYGPIKFFKIISEQINYFMLGLFVLLLVIVLFYSAFFQHSIGIRELLFGVQQWIGRGHSDVGHHKSFWYYRDVFETTEPQVILGLFPFILSLAFYVFYLLKIISLSKSQERSIYFKFRNLLIQAFPTTEDRLCVLFSLVFITQFLIYSYVPYKTPWLIINLSAPAIISASIFIFKFFDKKIVSIIFYLIIFGSLLFYSLKFNFRESALGKFSSYVKPVGDYGDNNPFAYVHTRDDMVKLGHDIEEYSKINKETRVLVGTKAYWPLPFYIREREGKIGYLSDANPESEKNNYDIMILEPGKIFTDPIWDKKFYSLADNQSSEVYFRRKDSK